MANLKPIDTNVRETKVMVYGSKNKLNQVHDIPFYMNNEIIESVGQFKYLGLVLDLELNFEAHISYTYRKACGKLNMLRKTRLCMNKNTACQMYKSLILPQLDYCDVVYMAATKTALKDLQKIQNICC